MLARTIGQRVRTRRKALNLTQGTLAEGAGVSLRFLVQLESGKGNVSLQRLADVCEALHLSLSELFKGLGPRGPIVLALVGLRGAGKSSIGLAASKHLNIPFVELDQEIVRIAEMSLSEIFAIGDSDYYHELESRALSDLLNGGKPCVLATGGSIVACSPNWERLKNYAKTVWLRASPASHLRRVQSQGDYRPMKGRIDALGELKQILASRERLYGEADLEVDTDRLGISGSVTALSDYYLHHS